MRRLLAIVPLIAVVLGTATPASAQLGGPIGAPVRFVPNEQTILAVEGRGPFRGTLELRREGAGVTIVNELSLDHYVMGVREVPGSWPMEALKAQAVAARTYVLWEMQKGYWKRFGFDVCGTVSCQVYQGATAEQGERGRRWAQAVRETSGQILFEAPGKPALTRYHSTSGGRTLSNEVVYPGDGARSYLKGVDDPFDRVSPLHRWEQRFTRAQLQEILRVAIGLNGTLTDITADEAARKVVIRTEGGELEMTSVRMRREMSETAPRVYPEVYPGTRSDGEPMPFTFPSSRFTVEKTEDGFVFRGRGYGHGVGMSQYGAKGRADEGAKYDEILGAYYGGLRPEQWNGTKMVRVAFVRSGGAVRITANGAFGVSTAGQSLSDKTFGSWVVASSGVRSLLVTPPQGHDLPLALTGVSTPEELVVDPPESGRTLDVSFVVPKSAQISAVVTRDGEDVARAKTVVEAGERKISVPLDPEKLERRGTYDVKLDADDGKQTLSQDASVVLIKPGMGLLAKIVWTLLVLLFVVIALRVRKVRGRRRPTDRIVPKIPARS